MTPKELKETLLLMCFRFVSERKRKILMAISKIEEVLDRDDQMGVNIQKKTLRQMLRKDHGNVGIQLVEIEKLEQLLYKIQTDSAGGVIGLGSLVRTKNANYFISISAGMVSVDGDQYICVSVGSPIGQLLLGKHPGDGYLFSGKLHVIEEIS